MNAVLKKIADRLEKEAHSTGFLDLMFGVYKDDALNGRPVVLFGAGALGRELHETFQHRQIAPVCFCDNNPDRHGDLYYDLPILSFDELVGQHKESLIVIAVQKQSAAISDQLIKAGFSRERIFCRNQDQDTHLLHMYSMIGSQGVLIGFSQYHHPDTIFEVLHRDEARVAEAYHLLADEKSKALYIAKLALMAAHDNMALFKDFMINFSEPIQAFGFFNHDGTTEDYFYFNNDVLSIEPGEIYVDVGAYDGDTIEEFIKCCRRQNLEYTSVYAFEPDPLLYRQLIENTRAYGNIHHHQLGVGAQREVLRFKSSDRDRCNVALLDESGNIEVEVVPLDEFLNGERVTFIKMDPGGNIIPGLVKGAAETIAAHKPKLALGAYHSLEAIYEIPLVVHDICPDYQLYLRHNTYHLCDTALYATV